MANEEIRSRDAAVARTRRTLYGSLALATAGLLTLIALGVRWWLQHDAGPGAGTLVGHAAASAGEIPGAGAGGVPVGVVALAILLLGVLGALALRSIRAYRFAQRFARHATEVSEFNQARLMDFVELSSDWLWETDTAHRCTLVSSGIRSIANMESSDFIGRALWEPAGEAGDDSAWSDLRHRLDRHEAFTTLISRKDLAGTLRHLEFSGKPLFDDGRFAGYRGVGRDATHRVDAERHLRNSEERYRSLVESFFDWYWEQDSQLRFTRVITSPHNPLPLREAEMLGRTRWELAGCAPDDRQWSAHIEQLQAHRPFDDFVYRRRMKDGSTAWFSVTGRPRFDASGRFTGYRGVARDVTREQLARQALTESEERYRTTIELAPVGIANADTDGRWTNVNRALAQFLGYDEGQLVGRRFTEFTHPAEHAADQAMLDGLLQGHYDSYARDKRYVHASGREIWGHTVVRALRDADGRIRKFIAAIQDIGPRVKAEQDRRAIEERYRRLVDVSPDGIVLHREGRLLFANRTAAQIFGAASADALVGHPLANFYQASHPQGPVPAAAATPGTPVPRGLGRIRRPDGSQVEVETSGVVVHFDDGPAILSVVRDVTERFATERALHESRTRYREVVESVNEVIFQTDTAANFQFLNQAWAHVSGHPVDASLGRPLADFVHPDDRRQLREGFGRVIGGQLAQFSDEVRIRTTEGEIRWLELHARLMRAGDGERLGAMGSMDDITARKVAELTLKNINKELEARVRARTAELEASNRELEAFSYSVSHDLRAPLRAIDGFALILQEDLGEDLDTTARTYLQRIRAASARMAQLIDDLIELARLTRQTLHRENLDLSLMVAQILDDIRQEAPDRQLDGDVALGLTANADRALMRVVLENLLRNAWKFSADRPVARIAFYATRDDDTVMFCIEDNGIGFDMAYAANLFAPFYRLHSAQEYSGSGIGLATVARIIQRHGGTIRAESAPGEGARFCFSIGH